MATPRPTQKQQVLALLKERGQIGLTALEAMQLANTMRLAAYVKFLKDDGFEITSETIEVPGGKHVARYRLVGEAGAGVKRSGLLFDVSKPAERN